jgi:hypothetical protein
MQRQHGAREVDDNVARSQAHEHARSACAAPALVSGTDEARQPRSPPPARCRVQGHRSAGKPQRRSRSSPRSWRRSPRTDHGRALWGGLRDDLVDESVCAPRGRLRTAATSASPSRASTGRYWTAVRKLRCARPRVAQREVRTSALHDEHRQVLGQHIARQRKCPRAISGIAASRAVLHVRRQHAGHRRSRARSARRSQLRF